MKSPTIREVAREAGVSPATVSRYLNKSIELPRGTSARIDLAVEQLKYRPNLLAKRLSRGTSETIGLVTPDIANPFFAVLAAAIEDEARKFDYSVLFSSTSGDPRREIANLERLDDRHVDGLIILTNRADDGTLKTYLDGRTDVILLDEDVPGARVPKIFVENEPGAYLATRRLIEAGHERIAHIGGPPGLFSACERFAGYRRAMREAKLRIDRSLVRFGAYERSAGLAAIRPIMGSASPPTAIFTGSDYVAAGVLQGLRELALRVPADVSLTSFDDMPFSDLLDPPITTVRQPIEALGRLGVRTLLAQLKGEPTSDVQRLPTQLVERRSVAAQPEALRRHRPDTRPGSRRSR